MYTVNLQTISVVLAHFVYTVNTTYNVLFVENNVTKLKRKF